MNTTTSSCLRSILIIIAVQCVHVEADSYKKIVDNAARTEVIQLFATYYSYNKTSTEFSQG